MSPLTSIKNLAPDDRPREKLNAKGREALSDAELMAILIGSGSSEQSAIQLCQEILKSVDNDLNKLIKNIFNKVEAVSSSN